ncbi:MAG: serine hydrolase [Candidatus Paceibacterota bacterium]|jgi:beta-lactamase class A
MAKWKGLIIVGLLIFGTTIGAFVVSNFSPKSVTTNIPLVVPQMSIDEKLSKFNFLDATKVLDLKKHYIVDFSDLKKELLKEREKQSFKSYIYFSYLNNNAWVGLGERDGFYAASLVKVPLAMATYKAIEDGRLTLDVKYTITKDDIDDGFGDLYKDGLGKTLTVKELVDTMLIHSDNTAKNSIQSIFSKLGVSDPMDDVYANLGWDFLPSIESGGDPTRDQNYRQISTKVLSNMFLALYSGTYLSLEHSQSILVDLAATPFNKQIDAGVPVGVSVAHKIGVSIPDKTFSDCGIVYAPNRNYILCVGVVGVDEAGANNFISNISKTVYQYVINN